MRQCDAGTRYGTHRVVEPKGLMPQAARVVDNSLPLHPSEILIDVEMLNVDAASFRQIKAAAGNDPKKVGDIILATVAERGKQHNPVTGSGGMLVGVVSQIGADYRGRVDARVGDRIATMVSLSLTPLKLHRVKEVHMDRDQVAVEGYAILFESGIAERLPDDLPRDVALAILDVAGAPAKMYSLVKQGMNVGIIGTGKSGLLCAAAARRILGTTGKVYGLDRGPESLKRVLEDGYVDEGIVADAKNPFSVYEAVYKATNGRLLDVVLNTTNVPDTEMATVLATRDGGIAYYFNMATSFTAAALGAEGAGKDVCLMMGNGYVPGHAKIAMDLVRSDARLMEYFESRYKTR